MNKIKLKNEIMALPRGGTSPGEIDFLSAVYDENIPDATDNR